MFPPGAIPKGAPYTSGVRHPGDHQHGPPPPQALKNQLQPRPQPPQQQPVDRMRNPLLREVDDQLRKLKSQFDMIRSDNYQPKQVATHTETVEAHHYTNMNSSSALKGVVGYQPQHQSFKPATSAQQLPIGQTSNTSSQPSIENKALGVQAYGQNKKITQSFEMKKESTGSIYNPAQPPRSNNPEQQYRSNVAASGDRIPSYKNYTGYQPAQQNVENKPLPAQNNTAGRQQSLEKQQQKSSTASQLRNQYGSTQDNSNKDSKEFKPSFQSPPPATKQFGAEQSQLKSPQEPLKFNFNSTDSYTDSFKTESFKAETFKTEYVRTEPDRLSTQNLLKEYGVGAPKQPQSGAESKQNSSSNSNTERADKTELSFKPKPAQEEQKKPAPQQRQNPHRSFQTAPATRQEPLPPAQIPAPVQAPAPVQSSVTQQSDSAGNSAVTTPRNEIQRYETFQSERVRYQDPNPYVSEETKKAAEFKEKRDLSPSQRERDASIKKFEAKKLSDLEERIGTLTKSNDTANRENAQLKHQVTKLTQQLRLVDKTKAEFQQMQITVKQTNERNQKLALQLEQAQITIAKRDLEIKDLHTQVRRFKETIDSDKTEGGFNMALKAQLEENQRVKERFSAKDEQIEQLRENNKSLRTQLDTFKNEVQIERLKRMTELKNADTNNEIEVQRLTNQVASLQKVAYSLDEKFKYMMKEDRKKDEFLVNYLKGKTHDPNDKDLIVNFFKQFEQVPKLTVSELLRQEYRIQEDLKKEIEGLKAQIITGYGGRSSPTRPAY